ncbi:MAG TPA: DAK2 domain-containing protein [Actinomycetota bacterium]
MSLYAEALRQHRDEINSLNVFPVPDGDTGTNLLLTQEAVERAVQALDGKATNLAAVGRAISEASLLGARGNSGVILSQVLRGLCERFPSEGVVGPEILAAALRHASEEADRAVARPVDGTMLSVLRDAAAAVELAVEGDTDDSDADDTDSGALLDAALGAARESLARTVELLPELRDAGVVDAGGKGVVLLFDALRAAVRRDGLSEPVGPAGPVGQHDEESQPGGDLEFAYEVQYLIEMDPAGLAALRARLEELGDSLVIVGGGGMYHVHIHTNDPDAAMHAAGGHGEPIDESVSDLGAQVTGCIAGQARGVRVAEQLTGLVAVGEGEGIVSTFRSLGAVVVLGGPGNNPSVGDLLSAIEAAPADGVAILPNHRNVEPAAEEAARASAKDTVVIGSASIPAGLAAAAAFNPLRPLAENAEAMGNAAATGRAGAVAQAERNAQTAAGSVQTGDWLGLSDGRVLVRDRHLRSAVARLAAELAGDAELVTLVTGADVTEEESADISRAVAEAVPGAELEVVRGGQPRYRYLIGAE